MTQGPACHTRPFSWLTLQGTLRILMFDLFLFSYLPHCQNRSVTVGLNTESVLLLFFRVKSPSLFFLCPSFTRSHPGSCLSSVYSLHSPVPTFPLSSPSLSANDFSSASHIASPLPLLYVSWYLCSSSSPIVLSLSLSLSFPASDLSAIWWDLDWERQSIGTVQQCTQERISGKETGPLHIKYHLTPNRLHLLVERWEEEDGTVPHAQRRLVHLYALLVYVGGGRSAR